MKRKMLSPAWATRW
ncbi:hypothetical protein [Pantoea agglomerans]